jgi:glycosyltransferase involved in cell wall biosynthesis
MTVRTMDSIYKKGYRPIDLIMVDDGSTDSTKDLALEWKNHKVCERLVDGG